MTKDDIYRFEEIGKSMMEGALTAVGKWVVITLIGFGIFAAICNQFGCGIDDSDTSGWQRSGLKIHTDAKTGVQYLSDGKGGLIRR